MYEYLMYEAPHLGMGIVVTLCSILIAMLVGASNKKQIDAYGPILTIVSVGLYCVGVYLLIMAINEAYLSWLWTAITLVFLCAFSTGALVGTKRNEDGDVVLKRNSLAYRLVKCFSSPKDMEDDKGLKSGLNLCSHAWLFVLMLIALPIWYVIKWVVLYALFVLVGAVVIAFMWLITGASPTETFKLYFPMGMNGSHPIDWTFNGGDEKDPVWPKFKIIGKYTPACPLIWIGLTALVLWVVVKPNVLFFILLPVGLVIWVIVSMIVGYAERESVASQHGYDFFSEWAIERVPLNTGERVIYITLDGLVRFFDGLGTILREVRRWITIAKGKTCPDIRVVD